jgi:hypothetical protein
MPKRPGGRSLPPTLLRAARIAVALQALCLLVVIGLTVPDFLDYLFHPLVCTSDLGCLDLRGLPFVVTAFFLGPLTLLLLVTCWIWRRPRVWPAILPLLVDVVIISIVLDDLYLFAKTKSMEPNIVLQLLFGLVPALVSLTLVLTLLLTRWATHPRRA